MLELKKNMLIGYISEKIKELFFKMIDKMYIFTKTIN